MHEIVALKIALLKVLQDGELGIPDEVFESTFPLRQWLSSELVAEADKNDQEAPTLDD